MIYKKDTVKFYGFYGLGHNALSIPQHLRQNTE